MANSARRTRQPNLTVTVLVGGYVLLDLLLKFGDEPVWILHAVPMQPQDEGMRLALPLAAGAALLLPLPMGHPDEARHDRALEMVILERQLLDVGSFVPRGPAAVLREGPEDAGAAALEVLVDRDAVLPEQDPRRPGGLRARELRDVVDPDGRDLVAGEVQRLERERLAAPG